MTRAKDVVEMPKDSMFGISVQTWGTQSRSSNGLINFADQQLFGGNVGHASINMTLPITSTTKEWLEKYCFKYTYEDYTLNQNSNATYEEYVQNVEKIIPVSIKTQTTRAAKYDSSGQIIATHEKAYEQAFFDVDWSWWPKVLHNTDSDMYSEREGKHFEYDEEWQEYLQPEQRVHRGELGSRKMTYAPTAIIHQRDIPSSELERITKTFNMEQIREKLKTVTLLYSKIQGLTDSKISPTIELMFKNLGMDVKQIIEETKEHEIDLADLDNLKEYLNSQLSEIKNDLQDKLDTAEQGVDPRADLLKVQDVLIDIEHQLRDAQKNRASVEKAIDSIDTLHNLFKSSESIPYTVEIDELLSSLPFIKDKIQLEKGSLSPKSIENLIDHIDELKEELFVKQKRLNDEDLNLIKKYEQLCLEYADDRGRLEDALYDESIDEEDVRIAKEKIGANDPEIEKLVRIQEQLRGYKETGLSLTSELEDSLTISVSQWRAKLDSPCQVIPKSAVDAIMGKQEQHRDELAKQIVSLRSEEENLQGELKKIEVEFKKTEEEFEKIKVFSQFYTENASAYSVIGVPPDHQISLPLAVNGNRGLQPEAMLKKMNELATSEKGFDLHTHNCSLTTIEVLSAGTEHDHYLNTIMEKRALGFFGTPQQVLENAKLAKTAISENQHDNFLSPLTNFSPLDRSIGYAMKTYMDPNASKTMHNTGLALAALVGVAKLPGMLINSVVAPKEKLDDLLYNINVVKQRNSTGLKIGTAIAAIPALTILAPCAAIQKGLQVTGSIIAKPFQFVTNWFKEKPVNEDEITVPVGSEPQSSNNNDSSYTSTMLAALLNSKIKSKIDENSIHIEYQESPQKLIEEFESKLQENPQKIIVLSPQAYDSVINFISICQDDALKQRFYDCCNQSIVRGQKFAPKGINEIDQLVQAPIVEPEKAELQHAQEAGNDSIEEDIHVISASNKL